VCPTPPGRDRFPSDSGESICLHDPLTVIDRTSMMASMMMLLLQQGSPSPTSCSCGSKLLLLLPVHVTGAACALSPAAMASGETADETTTVGNEYTEPCLTRTRVSPPIRLDRQSLQL
jgi:hypothetical protein